MQTRNVRLVSELWRVRETIVALGTVSVLHHLTETPDYFILRFFVVATERQ